MMNKTVSTVILSGCAIVGLFQFLSITTSSFSISTTSVSSSSPNGKQTHWLRTLFGNEFDGVELPEAGDFESGTKVEWNGLSTASARATLVRFTRFQKRSSRVTSFALNDVSYRSFAEVQMDGFNLIKTTELRQQYALEAIAKLSRRFKSEEAALVALFVEWPFVEYALNQARFAKLDEPDTYASFSRFLKISYDEKSEIQHLLALKTTFSLKSPLKRAMVSSKFGMRIHPVLGVKKHHSGIDLVAAEGTKLYASGRGVVREVGYDRGNGKYVTIDHGHGILTSYSHASEIFVEEGQEVTQETNIALLGSTGRTTGPHLHFQLEVDEQPIDPSLFIETFQRSQYSSLGH